MSTFRVLLLSEGSWLLPAVLERLSASPYRVRLGRSWDEVGAARRPESDEQIVVDWSERRSVLDAARACNYAIYVHEPDGLPLGEGVRRVRLLGEALRDGELERVVVTSCASMLGRGPGEALARERFAYLPGQGTPTMDARYRVELECLRLAADALDVVMVAPGLVVAPARIYALGGVELDPSRPISVIDEARVARAHLAALERGRAGARYGLGAVNTTAGELLGWLRARGQVIARGERPARLLDPLRRGLPLDTTRAREQLGLVPAPGLGELFAPASSPASR